MKTKCLRYAMQLSRYGGASPEDRTLRAENGAMRHIGGGGTSRPIVLYLPKKRILPRKEVIQPHVPVRLPCYDFTPITDLTFGACLPCGLAQRLRARPAFVM